MSTEPWPGLEKPEKNTCRLVSNRPNQQAHSPYVDMDSGTGLLPKFNRDFLVQGYICDNISTKIRSLSPRYKPNCGKNALSENVMSCTDIFLMLQLQQSQASYSEITFHNDRHPVHKRNSRFYSSQVYATYHNRTEAYVDGGDNGSVHLRESWVHEHEAVKQFDKLRQDATRTDAAAALLVVQTTDGARQLRQQLQHVTIVLNRAVTLSELSTNRQLISIKKTNVTNRQRKLFIVNQLTCLASNEIRYVNVFRAT